MGTYIRIIYTTGLQLVHTSALGRDVFLKDKQVICFHIFTKFTVEGEPLDIRCINSM